MDKYNITKFEKISLKQFKKDMTAATLKNTRRREVSVLRDEEEENLEVLYNQLEKPKRATEGSGGYDFKSPFAFELAPGETILIPTGITAFMRKNQVLIIGPRSGHGFTYRIQLDNTIAFIDADYCYSEKNEGHIMIKLTNDGHEGKILKVKKGEAFCQGVFLNYGITDDDDATGIRNGGFGSTDK